MCPSKWELIWGKTWSNCRCLLTSFMLFSQPLNTRMLHTFTRLQGCAVCWGVKCHLFLPSPLNWSKGQLSKLGVITLKKIISLGYLAFHSALYLCSVHDYHIIACVDLMIGLYWNRNPVEKAPGKDSCQSEGWECVWSLIRSVHCLLYQQTGHWSTRSTGLWPLWLREGGVRLWALMSAINYHV